MKEKILAATISAVMLISLISVFQVTPVSASPPATFTILFTNDSHARMEPLPRIATLVEEIRAEEVDLLLLDAGDAFLGDPVANFFDGWPIVEIMNLLGYDAMEIGNHEFDHGQDVLCDLAGEADFPLLAANLRWKDDPNQIPSWAKGYVIEEVGGVKVAIFGLITEDLPVVAHPLHVENLLVLDPIGVAENYVLLLEKADIIIALTHLGLDIDIKLATEVEGIDVIVGGHSHDTLLEPVVVENTIIVQAGEYYEYLGRLDLEIEGDSIVGFSYELIPTEGVAEDPETKAIVDSYYEGLEEIFAEVVGETLVPLDGSRKPFGVRNRETNLGDLVADSILWYLEPWDVDIAVQNGGGIRWHRWFPAGEITLDNVYELLPFPNVMVASTLPGENIWKALERSVGEFPNEFGGFLHIAGLKFSFDPSKPAGNRVENVWVDGEPLDNAKTYRVGMNDFTAAGGDGYVELMGGDNFAYTGVLYIEPFRAYLENLYTVDPTCDGRITALGYLDAGEVRMHETIQEAIDAASPGDTVLVDPGTYGPFTVVGKSDLTIEAASDVIVEGVQVVTTNYGDRDAVVFIDDSTDIALVGLTIGPNTGKTQEKDYGIIYENSSGTIKDCTVSPNTVGDMKSTAIGIWDGSDVTIDPCVIENFGRIGVFVYNGCTVGVYDSTIVGQVYSGEGQVVYGIEVEGAWMDDSPETASHVTIVGNEIYNCNNTFSPEPSWGSSGILINGWMEYFSAADSTVTIENNDIHSNYVGIYAIKSPSSSANFNNIYNNREYGVESANDYAGEGVIFDATLNWWGDPSGPRNPTTNPSATGDDVSDNVNYTPWLDAPYLTGVARSWNVQNVNTGENFNTIQAAIDAAELGDTVLVYPGMYNETLNLRGKALTIEGSGVGTTIVNASSFMGYAIQNFGSSSTIRNLTLIGTQNSYGFKVSHVSDIILENIKVENSSRTGIDLNTVNGATLNNIEVINTAAGFGIMILDLNNITVTNIATSNNAWGGVSVQTKGRASDSITFSGNFDAQEDNPLLLEKDPPAYYDITNVAIPSKFGYVVYAFRVGDNYKQWFYQETLDDAKAFAGALMAGSFTYSDMTIYDIAEENYYVIEGMSIQAAIDAASSGDTVLVGPGTYDENINIDKSLTVRSVEGAEATIINAQGAPIAVLINGADTVATFDGFTVDDYDTIGILAGAFKPELQGVPLGDDPLEVHILNNIVKPPTIAPPHNNNIQVGDGTTGTIIGNEVSGALLESPDWSGSGILVAGSSDVVVSNNYVHNSEGGIQIVGYEDYRDAPAVNNLVENNLVEGNKTGISVQGMTIGTIIKHNDVSNNDIGIGSLAYDFSWEQSAPSGTEIHYNNIVGNECGTESSVWWHHTGEVLAEQVDATLNWWGHPTGAKHATNPHGGSAAGDAVTDKVNFIPWYATATTSPTTQNVSVEHPGESIIAYSDTIQGGIDAALSGDTVLVGPGTYNGDIQIDKALTVKSTDGAEKTIIKGVDSNDYYLVRLYHSDVTFEGFTVTNPTYEGGADASGILIGAYLGESVDNVNILNNIVKAVRSGTTGSPSMYGATGINIGRGPLSNVVVSGNTIENIHNPDGAPVDHTCGINVWDNAENVVISNNTISDIKYNGIILEHASNVQIENNAITECKVGIRVEPYDGATVSDLTIHYNNIAGNEEYGVLNTTKDKIDATYNWWGHPKGPRRDKGGSGRGDRVSEKVLYRPWLTEPFQTVLEEHVGYYGSEGPCLEKGWNTFSAPIYLDNNAWDEIAACLDENIAYRFDASTQAWELMTTDSKLDPLDAIYIRMNSEDSVPLVVSVSITNPPVKELKRGWNLIGLAVWEDENMSVDRALVSVEQTPDGNRGYTIVVSSSLNQEYWAYTIGQPGEKPLMNKNEGYWVYMENPGNLAGFSSTPLPFWEPE